jgi:hypothetical protein
MLYIIKLKDTYERRECGLAFFNFSLFYYGPSRFEAVSEYDQPCYRNFRQLPSHQDKTFHER